MIDYAGNAGSSLEDGDGKGIYGDGRDGVIIDIATTPPIPFVSIRQHHRRHEQDAADRRKENEHQPWCTIEPQADDNEGYVGGFQDDVVRFGAATSPFGPITPNPDIPAPLRPDQVDTDTFEFGSSHPGVCQFVLCDGSVQAIAFTIDPAAFQYLVVAQRRSFAAVADRVTAELARGEGDSRRRLVSRL